MGVTGLFPTTKIVLGHKGIEANANIHAAELGNRRVAVDTSFFLHKLVCQRDVTKLFQVSHRLSTYRYSSRIPRLVTVVPCVTSFDSLSLCVMVTGILYSEEQTQDQDGRINIRIEGPKKTCLLFAVS